MKVVKFLRAVWGAPDRGRRRKIFALTGTTIAVGMGVFIASAFGILAGSPSNFESNDGNMVHTGTNHDWDNVSFNHVIDLASSQSDDSYVSGQKQDAPCPDTYLHGNPPKDDFTDIASYSETNNTANSPQFHHTFLYGATIRYTANGNASENVELKQGTDGKCAGSDLFKRVAGDKLIAIDYLAGGTDVHFNVLTWVTSGACFVSNHTAPCWGATVQSLSANAAEGLASQDPISASNNPISGQDLVAGQFAEFGVDLTASNIIPAGTCKSFPQTVWGSRSSGSSFVSTTKDIAVENHTISNCGSITIIKQTDPRGIDQKFSFTSANLKLNEDADAGGVACTQGGTAGVAADGSFCLNDTGNSGKTLGSTDAADNSTGNTVTESDLFPGTYTITEGADPSGFAFDKVTCTGGTTSTVGKTVTVTLDVEDEVVCVYENNQSLGAIKVTKRSIKSATSTLAGAHFQICTNAGPYTQANPCAPAKTGSGDLVTGNDGTTCIDGLAFGNYYVKETQAPTGYDVDDTTTHTVAVDNNAKCDDLSYGGEEISFNDTPLTDLTVHVESQVTGGTASSIRCVDSATPPVNIGDSPQPATGFDDPVDVTADDLHPGTYTCTVVIDP
jgi:hypothetical protein